MSRGAWFAAHHMCRLHVLVILEQIGCLVWWSWLNRAAAGLRACVLRASVCPLCIDTRLLRRDSKMLVRRCAKPDKNGEWPSGALRRRDGHLPKP